MRFLVDNQLPRALALHLRECGHDAFHVLDIGMDEESDAGIWDHAAAQALTVVTKDADFSEMALLRPEKVVVVWVRLGNCRTRELLAAFDAMLPAIVATIESGTTLVELY